MKMYLISLPSVPSPHLQKAEGLFSKLTSSNIKMSLRFAFIKLAGKSAFGLGNTGAQRQFVAAGICHIKIHY